MKSIEKETNDKCLKKNIYKKVIENLKEALKEAKNGYMLTALNHIEEAKDGAKEIVGMKDWKRITD